MKNCSFYLCVAMKCVCKSVPSKYYICYYMSDYCIPRRLVPLIDTANFYMGC